MLRQRAAAIIMFGITGAFAGGIGLGTVSRHAAPDAVLAGNYGSALADADTSWTSLPRNIWLSGLGGADAQTDRLLVAGDTITIDGKDGSPEVIEVTAREVIGGEHLGVPGVRFQLVTGHSTGPDRRTVRFMFATETPPAPLPEKRTSNRVL
ncbi:MAG: hypothetical protein AB7L90_03270 [Hyphomicrobiaceae bacterium]